MPSAYIQYGNLSGFRGMHFTFNRGVTPSVCTLYLVPRDDFNPPPGDLQFGANGVDLKFPDCAMRIANLRPRNDSKHPLWAVHVFDRRWKWKGGAIYGEYNSRIPYNPPLIPAAVLMAKCLDAMGETGYDVSSAPTNVYPYVKWDAIEPALALQALCDYCACDVVLNPLTNKVEIWPLGVGRNSPVGVGELHPKWKFTPRANVPSIVRVDGGVALYQYRLKLEAVARGTNLAQTQSPNWVTGITLAYESLNFPSVTDTVGSELALATGWRYFRVAGQEGGGLNVPGLSVSIGNVSQYDLRDFILYTAYDDRTQQYQLIDYYLEGDFWPYSDLPENTSNTVYGGKTKLHKNRWIVESEYPIIKYDSSGYITTPTLYLQTAYAVRDPNGVPVGHYMSRPVGGDGAPLVLKRPEVFAAFAPTQNSLAGTLAELDAYAALFQRKYQNPQASELTYSGIIPGTLDGNVCQATWSIHPTMGPRTKVCEQEELDVSSPSRGERRRREQLRALVGAG